MIEPEFVELMQDLITIEPRAAVDQYNNPTYGAAATYLARVQPDAQEIRDMMGNTQISSAQIWAVPLATSLQGVTGAIQRQGQWYVVTPFTTLPKPPDRITLPDGTQPLILRSAVVSDETGTPHHMKVYC